MKKGSWSLFIKLSISLNQGLLNQVVYIPISIVVPSTKYFEDEKINSSTGIVLIITFMNHDLVLGNVFL